MELGVLSHSLVSSKGYVHVGVSIRKFRQESPVPCRQFPYEQIAHRLSVLVGMRFYALHVDVLYETEHSEQAEQHMALPATRVKGCRALRVGKMEILQPTEHASCGSKCIPSLVARGP